MTTLSTLKEKLLNIFKIKYNTKSEINEKENNIIQSLDNKLNINDAFSGDYNDLENKPEILPINIITNDEEPINNSISIYKNSMTVVRNTQVGPLTLGVTFIIEGKGTIDWGDGIIEIINDGENNPSHNYESSGIRNIIITGNITKIIKANNNNLLEINFPPSVVSFGIGCFELPFLKKVNIPLSVTSLPDYCFYGSGIESIIILNNITSIGKSCFGDCDSLTSVVLPNSITTIEQLVFAACNNLETVSIPDSVVSIGQYCFNSCPKLKEYQLHWVDNNIMTYPTDRYNRMPYNDDTIFTIPNGQIQNYINKGYPADRLVERDD